MTRHPRGGALAVVGWVFLVLALIPLIAHLVLTYTTFWKGKNPLLGRLAKAAHGRVLARLASPDGPWRDAVAGRKLPGFNDDATYDDLGGGAYKVLVTSGPGRGEVTVRVRAFNPLTSDARVVQNVYSRSWRWAGALLAAGPYQMTNDFHVHWAPVYVHGALHVSTRPSLTGWPQNSNTFYPRKFASGPISPRDMSPSKPNTDNVEYWAFNKDPSGPPRPDIDYYRARAKESRLPLESPALAKSLAWTKGEVTNNKGPAVAAPKGSAYFSSSDNPGGIVFSRYEFRDPNAVVMVEAVDREAYVTNLDVSFLEVEALILTGTRHNLQLCASPVVFQATVPKSAVDEYKHPDAADIWYDPNPPPANPAPSFESVGAGNCCYPVQGANLHGFLYIGGRPLGSGCVTSSVVGTVVVAGDKGNARGWRDINIYADDGVMGRARLVEGAMPWRVSSEELPPR